MKENNFTDEQLLSFECVNLTLNELFSFINCEKLKNETNL